MIARSMMILFFMAAPASAKEFFKLERNLDPVGSESYRLECTAEGCEAEVISGSVSKTKSIVLAEGRAWLKTLAEKCKKIERGPAEAKGVHLHPMLTWSFETGTDSVSDVYFQVESYDRLKPKRRFVMDAVLDLQDRLITEVGLSK